MDEQQLEAFLLATELLAELEDDERRAIEAKIQRLTE